MIFWHTARFISYKPDRVATWLNALPEDKLRMISFIGCNGEVYRPNMGPCRTAQFAQYMLRCVRVRLSEEVKGCLAPGAFKGRIREENGRVVWTSTPVATWITSRTIR